MEQSNEDPYVSYQVEVAVYRGGALVEITREIDALNRYPFDQGFDHRPTGQIIKIDRGFHLMGEGRA